MNEQVMEILQKVKTGELTPEEATQKLKELGYEQPKDETKRGPEQSGKAGTADLGQAIAEAL